jgi:hypothetical protein
MKTEQAGLPNPCMEEEYLLQIQEKERPEKVFWEGRLLVIISSVFVI